MLRAVSSLKLLQQLQLDVWIQPGGPDDAFTGSFGYVAPPSWTFLLIYVKKTTILTANWMFFRSFIAFVACFLLLKLCCNQ